MRVIDCEITVATTSGRRRSGYRLVTTLTDHAAHPAADVVGLYHQRWEIETAYLELKSTLLDGRVLRARTPDGVAQEVYALLLAYQVLRLAMADATASRPGVDPDRAGFTIAVNAARDLVIQAAGVIAGTSTSSVPSGAVFWPICCPTGGCGSGPVWSNARSPSTTPKASWTGPATRPPAASTS